MREFDFIRQIQAQAPAVPEGMLGIGSDCCEWTPGGRTALSVDTVVEGVHFTPDTPAAAVGRKAAAAALSDLAAAGARPVGAVVALSLPKRWDGVALMAALSEELARHGCAVLGGDTTGSEHLVVSVTVWGEAWPAERAGAVSRLLRRTGHVGDLLVVTGPLGGSFASGRHLRPEPRFAQGRWLAACPWIHGAMDLSDGLAGDAVRLAEAAGCGVMLLPAQVPVHPDVPQRSDTIRAACCDGEDFELLATVAPEHWPSVQLAYPFDEPLCVVGWLVPEPGATMEDRTGRRVPLPWGGFEHR
jgi:thiamine-monophosphate kinase